VIYLSGQTIQGDNAVRVWRLHCISELYQDGSGIHCGVGTANVSEDGTFSVVSVVFVVFEEDEVDVAIVAVLRVVVGLLSVSCFQLLLLL